MMRYVEWAPFLVLMGLITSSLTLTTQRFRQYVFAASCTIGAGVGAYGFFLQGATQGTAAAYFIGPIKEGALLFRKVPPEASYFRTLGLPLSLTVVITLCFAVFAIDQALNRSFLQKWIYPAVCWYLALWIALDTTLLLRFAVWSSVAPEAYRIAFFVPTTALLHLFSWLIIFIGLVSSALWKFNRYVFQVLFPVAAIAFFSPVVRTWMELDQPSGELVARAFFMHTWPLFWLIGYYYVNANIHEASLKRNILANKLAKKLPKAAMVLIVISFTQEFPGWDWVRHVFPTGAAVFQYTTIGLDISVIVTAALFAVTGSFAGKDSRFASA